MMILHDNFHPENSCVVQRCITHPVLQRIQKDKEIGFELPHMSGEEIEV